jgi:hypothetical protein
VYLADHAHFGGRPDWASFIVDAGNWTARGCTVAQHSAWAKALDDMKLDAGTPLAWDAPAKLAVWHLLPAALQRACLNLQDQAVSKLWFTSEWAALEPMKQWGIRLMETQEQVGIDIVGCA